MSLVFLKSTLTCFFLSRARIERSPPSCKQGSEMKKGTSARRCLRPALVIPELGSRLQVLAILAAAVGTAKDGALGEARICVPGLTRSTPHRMLRLRGGYRETDRVLQARLAAERADVAAGWYNATATDVFPWNGWDTHRREEFEGAPHIGFLGGTGRWLGPSLEQVRC